MKRLLFSLFLSLATLAAAFGADAEASSEYYNLQGSASPIPSPGSSTSSAVAPK